MIFCAWYSLTQHYYVFETHLLVSVVNFILWLNEILWVIFYFLGIPRFVYSFTY